MDHLHVHRPSRDRKAFSLLELPQVMIMLGVLTAAVGLPCLLQNDERGKAADAFRYLFSVQEAQERYRLHHGRYADDISLLDTEQNSPTYFAVDEIVAAKGCSLADSWSLTLTRSGGRGSGYGAYTVTFNQNGYDAAGSSIDAEVLP